MPKPESRILVPTETYMRISIFNHMYCDILMVKCLSVHAYHYSHVMFKIVIVMNVVLVCFQHKSEYITASILHIFVQTMIKIYSNSSVCLETQSPQSAGGCNHNFLRGRLESYITTSLLARPFVAMPIRHVCWFRVS